MRWMKRRTTKAASEKKKETPRVREQFSPPLELAVVQLQ